MTPSADAFERESERRARAMLAKFNISEHVGKRHHIVPRSHLARFADGRGQLLVRDRVTGVGSTRNIRDLAVKDFYTAINVDGRLDSSMESLLAVIEADAAQVWARHLSASTFRKARPFTLDERLVIDLYTSFQIMRGMRARRCGEQIVDYYVKFTNQEHFSDDDFSTIEIAPHQNEHIKGFAIHGPKIEAELLKRPAHIVTFDRPHLVISDEPVVLVPPDDWISIATPNLTGLAPVQAAGIDPEDIVMLMGDNNVGLTSAKEVVMPLSPSAALVYGPRGAAGYVSPVTLRGVDAEQMAHAIDALVVRGAMDWAAANPQHGTFGALPWPDVVPILRVIDGGSNPGRSINANSRRKPNRLDRNSMPRA